VIPALTSDGLLPPGIHSASLDDVRQRFAIFQDSDQRLRVFDGLQRLVADAISSGVIGRIIIGGSFVSGKQEPNDFDCILVLAPQIVGQTLRPFEYNVISRRMARRLFGGDVLAVLDGSAALQEYLKFFQTTRDGTTVGVVEIRL
jgi:hypothetical protein